MSTKNTILKKYDGRFKDIFQEIYDTLVVPEHYGVGANQTLSAELTRPSSRLQEFIMNTGSLMTWWRK